METYTTISVHADIKDRLLRLQKSDETYSDTLERLIRDSTANHERMERLEKNQERIIDMIGESDDSPWDPHDSTGTTAEDAAELRQLAVTGQTGKARITAEGEAVIERQVPDGRPWILRESQGDN